MSSGYTHLVWIPSPRPNSHDGGTIYSILDGGNPFKTVDCKSTRTGDPLASTFHVAFDAEDLRHLAALLDLVKQDGSTDKKHTLAIPPHQPGNTDMPANPPYFDIGA